jgi:CheY-like chemotaxis protein
MCAATQSRAAIDVLIAEDDPLTRMAVRQVLEDQGYTCAEAENGQEAIECAQECPPRLVLMDLMMPDLDGYTAAERLRAHPRTRKIPIHCLSALDFPAARRAAQRSGFEAFIAKPVDMDGLLDVVSSTLHSDCGQTAAQSRPNAEPVKISAH